VKLTDALRSRLANPLASSFQLMGEDLQLLTIEDLHAAIEAHEAAIPDDLRADLLVEEASLARECHAWLTKYNRSLYGRIAGYVALGKRIDFAYPWPVVAVLGIVQVLGGMDRARLYGLAGRVASRLGYDWIEKLGDGSEDVLRRTNRGIFADSVPTVLRAIRAVQLHHSDRDDLADALVDGYAAVVWDAESRSLCRAIVDGLLLADRDAQFRALADTTARHFAREQTIFTHHIASKTRTRKLPPAKSVPAPVIEKGKLAFRPYALPSGFDFRDHDTRVREFEKAFVRSVTGSRADYQVATAWVTRRFGSP
jgi:hypothetical protein